MYFSFLISNWFHYELSRTTPYNRISFYRLFFSHLNLPFRCRTDYRMDCNILYRLHATINLLLIKPLTFSYTFLCHVIESKCNKTATINHIRQEYTHSTIYCTLINCHMFDILLIVGKKNYLANATHHFTPVSVQSMRLQFIKKLYVHTQFMFQFYEFVANNQWLILKNGFVTSNPVYAFIEIIFQLKKDEIIEKNNNIFLFKMKHSINVKNVLLCWNVCIFFLP